MPVRWAGIDEAGYGPNLGPLVMTAVVAETLDDRPPDLWNDLGPDVCRAGGNPGALWVDDSKAVYRGGIGRDRLDDACLALLSAVGHATPQTFGGLLAALGAGSLDDVELTPWLDSGDPPWTPPSKDRANPFEAAPWRVVAIHSVVVGPAMFNQGLVAGGSKARVHQDAFARLIRRVWDDGTGVEDTHIRSDKHGGRHFYHGPLAETFPGAWIDRGPEGPALSRYVVHDRGRRLHARFEPRADASDGLVALASIVSKTAREVWMDAFNAHWTSRIAGLRPTAGYPVDARRFRRAIEAGCLARGLGPEFWWRDR